MDIIIRNTGEQPIYEQIKEQIKAQIVSGTLETGSALPSIRALAKDLRISVITTKRAYDELERDGYIVTAPGRGSFVAERDMELVREAHLQQIEAHMRAILRLSASCKLGRDDLIEMLDAVGEGEYERD